MDNMLMSYSNNTKKWIGKVKKQKKQKTIKPDV